MTNELQLAVASCLAITSLYIYKRLWGRQDELFILSLGEAVIEPRLRLFSICSSLLLAIPINYKVTREGYRELTNAVQRELAIWRFKKQVEKAPIYTVARHPDMFSEVFMLSSDITNKMSSEIKIVSVALAITFIITLITFIYPTSKWIIQLIIKQTPLLLTKLNLYLPPASKV